MDAVAVGSLYALIALGYTMVYGILKFINFAHSDVFVLGAWVSFSAAMATGWGAPDGTAAPWVWWGLWILTGAAAVATAVEFGLSRGTGFNLRQTRYAGVLLLMTVWAWAEMLLVIGARVGHHAPGWEFLSVVLILLCAMLTCGLVGFTLERVAYKPLRSAPRLNVLITAIGVSLLLQNTGQLEHMFGTRPTRMPGLLPEAVLAEIGG